MAEIPAVEESNTSTHQESLEALARQIDTGFTPVGKEIIELIREDFGTAVDRVQEGLQHDHPLVALEYAKHVADLAVMDLEEGYKLLKTALRRENALESPAWTDVHLEIIFRMSWVRAQSTTVNDGLFLKADADSDLSPEEKLRVHRAYKRSP